MAWILAHPILTFILGILFLLVLDYAILKICRTIAYIKLIDKMNETQLEKEISEIKKDK